VFVEGGITLAILTAIFHGVDPRTSFLIGEGLVFSWWLCATYTGIFRQQLQRKYHLEVTRRHQSISCIMLNMGRALLAMTFLLLLAWIRTLPVTLAMSIAAYTGVPTARSIVSGGDALQRAARCPCKW
jgi:hypothetical protein